MKTVTRLCKEKHKIKRRMIDYNIDKLKTMFTSAIKKQTSVCCVISLNPYMVFQTWNHG